jgi:heat shock protein HslJ
MTERPDRLVVLAAGLAAFALAVSVATPSAAGAPSQEELKNATFRGIYEVSVTLDAGEWEGEPFVPGGASRPRVVLARDFRLVGDLAGDDDEEAVVLLSESSGGTGTNSYLAVVGRRGEGLVNLGTALVGDRVQIRSARIADRRIELDVVQAGPEDAACCPSQKATRGWALGADGLKEVASEVTGTLSLADLAGVEWVLTHFAWQDPAPAEPVITLVFEGERVTGSSGCNRYFAGVEAGGMPGNLKVGPVGGTRMACPEDRMSLEGRYLKALERVVNFRFVAGRLVLVWREDGVTRGMLFAPRMPTTSNQS